MMIGNEMWRHLLPAYIEQKFTDPALREKMVPPYPPLAKRVVRDDGSWAAALQQDHVSVLTDKIEASTEKGVRTSDGVEHVVDVIIYGTGLAASEDRKSTRLNSSHSSATRMPSYAVKIQ